MNLEISQKSPSENMLAEPLLFIDINITPTHTERLEVFPGDTPMQLASDFCYKHQLSEKMHVKLVRLL